MNKIRKSITLLFSATALLLPAAKAVVTITNQPVSVYTDIGDLVIFEVAATSSTGTLNYAWQKDSVSLADNEYIAGSAYSRLVVSPARSADTGNYRVIVSDIEGSVTSSVAGLTLTLPLPAISAEPSDTTVATGGNAVLSVVVTNAVSFQWYKEETALPGETGTTLQLNGVTQTNTGVYSVKVANNRGTVSSKAARLTVTSAASLNEALDNNGILIDNSAGWFSQTDYSYDGFDAVQSADIGDSETTEINLTLIGPGDYSFYYASSSEYSYDYIRWLQDGTQLGARSGGSTPSFIQGIGFVADKAHIVTYRYTKDGGSSAGLDSGFVDQFVFTPYGLSSVETAVDNPPAPIVLGGDANWYGQDNRTFDGTDAARSPKIGHNGTAWFETTVQGPGMVVFRNYVSSEYGYDYLRYSVDDAVRYSRSGTETTWVGVTNWVNWGTHTLRWSYSKDGGGTAGDDAVWVDQISYTPVDLSSLAEAADNAELEWITSGTNPWFGQDRFTFDGTDAVQSGVTDHNGESWIKTTVAGPGTLSFKWSVSSENGYDYLRFFVDGNQKLTRSGTTADWVEINMDLTNSAPYELMWKYTKESSGSHGEDAGWIDQVLFAPQRDPVTLDVTSILGSPDPAAGITTNDWGTVVTCSVANVTVGTTQFECTGWAGTGSISANGSGNQVIATLEENSSISWLWQTNYWLDVNITGNGSVSHSDDFYAKDSEQTLIATPDSGWLFMGWSGAASGTNNAVLTMDAPKTVMATFSDDADGDGLTNAEEAGYGSNPWLADTDGDGFDDAFEVAQGLNVTNDSSAIVTYIQNHDSSFGLYTSNAVFDVAIGQMLVEISGGNATLSLQLEASDDLVTWTNAGPSEVWSWPVDSLKKYFRVKSSK